MHSVSSKNPRCVYLRAVCLTESWCVEYLYRGYLSHGWWIINEFVFESVSWSWRGACRCLCLDPLHPSLSDLPASPSLFLYFLLRVPEPGTAECLGQWQQWDVLSVSVPFRGIVAHPLPSTFIYCMSSQLWRIAFRCFPGWFFFSVMSLSGYSLSLALFVCVFQVSDESKC